MTFTPFEEKTSQSGQEEEKSKVETQDMSIKSCSGVWISAEFTACNMALWRALALLSMMVPAVVSKRLEKPVLSTRMALSHIYNAGYKLN